MSRRRVRWADMFAPVGEAGLNLVRAEYGVISSEIKGSGRALLRVFLLLALGLFVVFWAVGAFAYLLVEVGSIYLPRWGATLAVLGLFLLTALILTAVARRRLRAIDNPAQTVQRRLRDHRDWWEHRIAVPGSERRGPGSAGPGEEREP